MMWGFPVYALQLRVNIRNSCQNNKCCAAAYCRSTWNCRVGLNCIDKQMIMCSAKLLEGFRTGVYGLVKHQLMSWRDIYNVEMLTVISKELCLLRIHLQGRPAITVKLSWLLVDGGTGERAMKEDMDSTSNWIGKDVLCSDNLSSYGMLFWVAPQCTGIVT